MSFCKIVWNLSELFFSGSVIYGSMILLLCLEVSGNGTVLYRDKNENKNRLLGWGGLALGNAGIVVLLCRMEQAAMGEGGSCSILWYARGLLLSLLAGGLLAAATMDARNCYVYNYVWWWCLLWIVALLCLPVGDIGYKNGGWLPWTVSRTDMSQIAAMLVFTVLQQTVFARMYGRADSHAFCVCALAGGIWRYGMLEFLVHMLLAVVLLAIVQFWKHNVTPDGRLQIPKPFVPYIIITFWLERLGMLYIQGR